jgi:alanyl-tRNA synthetase
VRAAGDIGPFVILSEAAIQAGVRRIEAVTGAEAVAQIQRQRRLLRDAARALKAPPEELPARIEGLQEQVKAAKKGARAGEQADLAALFERLEGAIAERSGVKTAVLDLPEAGLAGLGELGDRAKSLSPDHAFVLLSREGDKVPFLVLAGGRARERGVAAGELAKLLAGVLGGGGGGRPDRAQGQGLSADAVPQALDAARAALQERLG